MPVPKPRIAARLVAPTHTPRVGVRWPYSVHVATLGGRPLRATITVQIVDPVGGTHPVQFRNTKRDIVRLPFVGTYRDWVTWPPRSALGIALRLRATVHTARGSAVLTYPVVPHR